MTLHCFDSYILPEKKKKTFNKMLVYCAITEVSTFFRDKLKGMMLKFVSRI